MFVRVNACGVGKGIYGLHNLYSMEEGREIRGRVLQLITWNLYESLCRFNMSDWRTFHRVSSFPTHSLNLRGKRCGAVALSFSSSYVLLRESRKCALQPYKCGPMGEQDIRNSSRTREIR
jgi:hypothetical protein